MRVHPPPFQPRARATSPPHPAPSPLSFRRARARGPLLAAQPLLGGLGDSPWWPQPVRCPQQHMDRAGVLVGVLAGQALPPRCVRHGVLCLAGPRPPKRCPWGPGRPGSLLICDRRLLSPLCLCMGLARKPPYSQVVRPHQCGAKPEQFVVGGSLRQRWERRQSSQLESRFEFTCASRGGVGAVQGPVQGRGGSEALGGLGIISDLLATCPGLSEHGICFHCFSLLT